MNARYIGLMSGTSMDGVDLGLIEFQGEQAKILKCHHQAYPDRLLQELREVAAGTSRNELHRSALLDRQLGIFFGQTIRDWLQREDIKPESVQAIGSHGQTLRHHPAGDTPYTLQIGDPSTIAELTGIPVVADFRRRDMAAGGQGAPLVPPFHKALFGSSSEERAVLNLGGIANLTFLPAKGPLSGFDTGPGNTLIDAWIRIKKNRPFDRHGAWAASGRVISPLLKACLDDPYFALAPPKSTGPEHFNLDWLAEQARRHCGTALTDHAPQDVQATLTELTACSVAAALEHHQPKTVTLLVCGGGTHNDHLMQRLRKHLPDIHISPTSAYGIDPDWVEAAAFAWLARRTRTGLAGNAPEVTGARHEVILGALYPA